MLHVMGEAPLERSKMGDDKGDGGKAHATVLWVGRTKPPFGEPQSGVLVWYAEDGHQALDLLRSIHIDVVVAVHGEVAGMTAIELAGKSRRTAGSPPCLLIAIELDEDAERLARSAGVAAIWSRIPTLLEVSEAFGRAGG